jgi:hypothetical protein
MSDSVLMTQAQLHVFFSQEMLKVTSSSLNANFIATSNEVPDMNKLSRLAPDCLLLLPDVTD